jgi:helicase SWR1
MTKVLDILEQFLNIHGWRYLRLDGATKIEQRQVLTERFNQDDRIPIFILSTRSGGLGINLTGADTVIFYDSDWNPSMDKQCQDRCHRIGQTRDVHIYRFVSEYTIESNILKKATQKQILDNVVIQEGDFTTDYFNKITIGDMLGTEDGNDMLLLGQGVKALEQAEDQDDVVAANVAMKEDNVDLQDFTKTVANTEQGTPNTGTREQTEEPVQLLPDQEQQDEEVEDEDEEEEQEEEEEVEEEEEEEIVGHVDDYMIRFIEQGYFY